MIKNYLLLLFVAITFIGAVPPNPTYRPSQNPSYDPTIYPTYSQNPTVNPSLRPTVTPNFHSITKGVGTESTASFLLYSFLNGVNTVPMVYPDAPLNAPYLHVELRSSYQYQIGYVTDFNFSKGTIVDAPSDLFIDLPLTPPVPPEYVDQQDPGSSAFAHQLFGIALDGVPIYSGLIDHGVDFFHVIESSSPSIPSSSPDSSGLAATATPVSTVSNMKVDFCGGSYGPTEPYGQGIVHDPLLAICILDTPSDTQPLTHSHIYSQILTYPLIHTLTHLSHLHALSDIRDIPFPTYSPHPLTPLLSPLLQVSDITTVPCPPACSPTTVNNQAPSSNDSNSSTTSTNFSTHSAVSTGPIYWGILFSATPSTAHTTPAVCYKRTSTIAMASFTTVLMRILSVQPFLTS